MALRTALWRMGLCAAPWVLAGCLGYGIDDTELQDPSAASFREATRPLGAPCQPPPGGWSDIAGEAFGTAAPEPRQTALELQEGLLVVDVGASFTRTAACDAETRSTYMRFIVWNEFARLGTVELTGTRVFASIEYYREGFGFSHQARATRGSLTFEGYDPTTRSLCGSVDVQFDEADGGFLVGSFQAPALCP
jgi:hypothetical protein